VSRDGVGVIKGTRSKDSSNCRLFARYDRSKTGSSYYYVYFIVCRTQI